MFANPFGRLCCKGLPAEVTAQLFQLILGGLNWSSTLETHDDLRSLGIDLSPCAFRATGPTFKVLMRTGNDFGPLDLSGRRPTFPALALLLFRALFCGCFGVAGGRGGPRRLEHLLNQFIELLGVSKLGVDLVD